MDSCRILVVENNLNEAKQIAAAVESPLRHIEITNSASWAIAEIERSIRWDLIISDVYIPKASDVSLSNARQIELDKWTCWKVPDLGKDGEFLTGGFNLASFIENKRMASPISHPVHDLKLILVSRWLTPLEKVTLAQFESNAQSWFVWHFKPMSLEALDLFRLDVDRFMRLGENSLIGRAAHDPVLDEYAGRASYKVRDAILRAKQLSDEVHIDFAFVLGPEGTGKLDIARIMHDQRMHALGRPRVDWVVLDCRNHSSHGLFSVEAFGNPVTATKGAFSRSADLGTTLVLDGIDALDAATQDVLASFVESKRFGSHLRVEPELFKGSLVVFTSRWDVSLFEVSRLRKALAGIRQIVLPALQDRREDAADIAERMLRDKAPQTSLSEAARNAFLTIEWPRNAYDITAVVLDLVHAKSSTTITGKDVQSSVTRLNLISSTLEADAIRVGKKSNMQKASAKKLGRPRETVLEQFATCCRAAKLIHEIVTISESLRSLRYASETLVQREIEDIARENPRSLVLERFLELHVPETMEKAKRYGTYLRTAFYSKPDSETREEIVKELCDVTPRTLRQKLDRISACDHRSELTPLIQDYWEHRTSGLTQSIRNILNQSQHGDFIKQGSFELALDFLMEQVRVHLRILENSDYLPRSSDAV